VRGGKEHCEARTVVGIRGRGGAFADYLALPAANLHEVPPTIDDEAAVFVEPVAAACRIAEQVDVKAAARTAVIGDGRLGILVAQVLRIEMPQVTVIGRHTRKLAIARRMGIDAREIGPGDSQQFGLVVDATGRREGLAHAIQLVKPRGTIVLKSTFHGAADTALWPVAVHEVTIVGSRCGPFARAIAVLASGQVQTAPLVSGHFALEAYEPAFAAARDGLKVLFNIAR
jgi:alcohol dehydrogenase